MADAWGGSWGNPSAWGVSWGTSGAAPTPTRGGWLTKEQAAAQLRELKRLEREENDRRVTLKKRALELEDTIEEAYARATGKKRTARALEGTEKPKGEAPAELIAIAKDVAGRLSGALQGSGKRYTRDRDILAQIEAAIADMVRLLESERAAEDEAEAMLLMMVI